MICLPREISTLANVVGVEATGPFGVNLTNLFTIIMNHG